MLKLVLLIFGICATSGYSINLEHINIPWTASIKELRPSIKIPIEEEKKRVSPTWEQILARIYMSRRDPTIEKVGLYFLDRNHLSVAKKVFKIAKNNNEGKLLEAVLANMTQAEENRFFSEITSEILPYVDKTKLLNYLGYSHSQLQIDGSEFKNEKRLIIELLNQTDGYLSYEKRVRIKMNLMNGQKIDVQKDLVPEFAKKNIEQFNIVKGPNCFQAALAFQGESFASLPFINAKREIGYDSSMINHDELWNALQTSFYEVNPKKGELKYGDIIVLSDIHGLNSRLPFDFRRLKHATTFLFDGFVFSKGSKSANSPYIISSLDEEWQHWEKNANTLGAKVFRRSFKNVRHIAPAAPEAF